MKPSVKLNGKWIYLYSVLDRYGNRADFFISERRDRSADLSFFRKAIKEHKAPSKVVVDKSGSNKAALDALHRAVDQERSIQILQNKYFNNSVEQDHSFIKKQIKPMLGLKCFDSATIVDRKNWTENEITCFVLY